jgi:hypothetical protein
LGLHQPISSDGVFPSRTTSFDDLSSATRLVHPLAFGHRTTNRKALDDLDEIVAKFSSELPDLLRVPYDSVLSMPLRLKLWTILGFLQDHGPSFIGLNVSQIPSLSKYDYCIHSVFFLKKNIYSFPGTNGFISIYLLSRALRHLWFLLYGCQKT